MKKSLVLSILALALNSGLTWASSALTPLENVSTTCSVGRLSYSFSETDRRIWQHNPGDTVGLELVVTRFEVVTDHSTSWIEAEGAFQVPFVGPGLGKFTLRPVQPAGDASRVLDFSIFIFDPLRPSATKPLVRKDVPCSGS